MKRVRRKWLVLLALLGFCFAGIQLVRPALPNPPVTGNVTVPPDVEAVLRRACFDCHSNETSLKWFDRIAPAYWLVRSHVMEGREKLNFSTWDKLSPGDRKSNLFFALNTMLAGEMPPGSYTAIHRDAKISDADINTLKNYLSGISPRIKADSAAIQSAEKQFDQWQHQLQPSVKPTLNGIEFLPDYKNWTPVSSTDRFDNGTMRVILGNAIAVDAIKENRINPWPDGSAFAKVAWKQSMDSTGMIRPGEFLQVEFMIRDNDKYRDTKGWGWARWKGMDLIPYGKTELFTTECITCHRPMKDNDFVFTMPLHIKPLKR